MIRNVFRTAKAAIRFLAHSNKTLKGRGINKASDRVVAHYKKATGHSHTTLRDMASKARPKKQKMQKWRKSKKYK